MSHYQSTSGVLDSMDTSAEDMMDIEKSREIELASENGLSTSLTSEMTKLYAYKASEIKSKIDLIGAEISQRHEKMRAVNDLIVAINNITDEENSIDITDNEEILQKMQIVQDLGVKIPQGQLKFNSLQRDRLIENLHLTADSWDKENKTHTQKMEICMKEVDRYMMILKELSKDEKQIKQGMSKGIG